MIRSLAVLLLAVAPVVTPVSGVAQAPGCDVSAASLTWGFKESFRAYIDGSIANGEWTVADGATYSTPDFGFTADAGRIDPRGPVGSVAFDGSVRFTGHGGVLDTTIARPTLVFRGAEHTVLLLDVSGPTMEGDEVEVTGAEFATVDLTGQDLTPVDGVITIDAAPTTLTEDGAAAFPNYQAGSAFDPVSATFDVGACDLEGQPIGTDVVGAEPMPNAAPWLALIAGAVGLLVVIAVVGLVLALRGRRS